MSQYRANLHYFPVLTVINEKHNSLADIVNIASCLYIVTFTIVIMQILI